MSQRLGVPTYARGGGRYLARHIALSVLLAILLSCTGVALVSRPTVAASGRAPGGNMQQPLVREVDIAQPAIVRIATIYNVHATFTLCGLRYSLPTSGQGYLVGGTGSGAFISGNGDILTADHVVDIPQEDLQAEVVQVGAADIANLLDNNPTCHLQQPVTAAEIAAGFLQAAGIPFTVESSLPRSLVWQSTSFAGAQPSAATSDSLIVTLGGVSNYPAKILKSSPFTENDLAILHVNISGTPSIQLDDSSSVAVEDQLTIIGFPGNGDVNNTGTDLLTPSVNNILVSAIKNGTNGQKLIQVGGNVEHGDSGGPALDSDGHIVGVVSFGGDDPRGITAFLRSSNNALSLMSEANVNPKPGTLQVLWRQAFSDYAATYAGHWRKAARELDDLAARYPAFQGVKDYKAYADTAALTEPVPTAGLTTLEEGGAALALLLAAVLIIVLLVRLRRHAAGPALAAAPVTQALYGQYPYQPYGYGGYGPPSSYGPSSSYGSPSSYRPPSSYGSPSSYDPSSSYGGYGSPSNYLPPVGYSGGPVPSSAPPAEGEAARGGYSTGSFLPSAPSQTSGASYSAAPQPQSPSQSSAPIATSLPYTGEAGASTGPILCIYGHPMAAGEIYCPRCGAPRAQI